LLQTGVVVRHHKLHPLQAALLQSQQKLPPTRRALPVGQINAQDLTPAFAIHRNRNQHRLAGNHPAAQEISRIVSLLEAIEHEIAFPLEVREMFAWPGQEIAIGSICRLPFTPSGRAPRPRLAHLGRSTSEVAVKSTIRDHQKLISDRDGWLFPNPNMTLWRINSATILVVA
jgi:hypothetical protein